MQQHLKQLMMTLALLVTATGAWADDLYVEINGTSATLKWGDAGTYPKYTVGSGFTDTNFHTISDVETIETVTVDETCQNHNLTNLNALFRGWLALTTINNIENLKTEGVNSTMAMFNSCTSLQTLDLCSFKMESIEDISYMFRSCSSLTTVDLSSWNTASVKNMSRMFSDCTNLENIYVGDDWSTAAVASSMDMFYRCSKLPNFSAGNVTHAMAKLTDDGGYLKTKPIELTWDATTRTATLDEMPEGNVVVDVEYYSRTGVTLSVTGQTQGGTARLLKKLDDGSFADMTDEDQVREDNMFILMVDREDGYDFKVPDMKIKEFTEDEYVEYYNWAKANDVNVPLNSALLWVTMPYVESGNLGLEVNFQQLMTYTILYQPATGQNPDVVACKMERSVNGVDKVTYMAMQRGASMGDGTAVWTTTMQAAYGPTKVAFVPVAEGTTEADLTDALNNAALSNATVSQSPDTWKSLSGANYLIYGGNAKVATAIFVADGSSMTVFKDLEADEATTEGGMTYKLAVCVTDAQGRVTTPGTVTAPAAPAAPQGKQFGGWRGLTYVAGRPTESVFTAGSTINVYGTTTFTAVWTPLQIQTTFALNGGANFDGSKTVDYGQKLNVSGEPTRSGLVFDYWTVAKAVNESGILFGKGSKFDMNTPLTANLNLTAQWKHVHEYVSYPISAFGDALANYMKYNKVLHIAICNCNDIKIVEHEFNPAGRCACGYEKPGATQVELEIAYGKLDGTTFNKFMEGFPQFAKRGDEVTVEAFHNWGDLEFKTWQYSTDGGQTWEELAAFEIVGFLIPCNMTVRALYVNPVQTPTIELASSEYLEPYEYQGTTYKMGNILYQMDYKLPDGYKLLDAGIRLGDNAGISYYIEQTQKYSLDAEAKGVAAGIGAGVAAVGVVGNVFLGGGFDIFSFTKDYGKAMFNKTEEVVYLEREDNVIEKEDKIDAAILAKKMYEGTPINVEKYDPIYWEAKAPTKGLFGSICTTPPLRFAQKNNQDHYIYGIAYMRYETPDKQMKTLYTDAIAATVNNPSQHTSKMEQAPSARQAGSGFSSDETAAAARKAPKREPEQQEAETLDMSTVTAPQTQLVVYVDGDYSAALSDSYGYNEKVTVTAPTVAGKTFSYWQADGGTVVTTDADLTLTMKANTTLRAVYDAATVPAASAVGITSATRTADGQSIVLQAIANGTFDTAGFVYSTTVAVPEINTDGVTRVGAVSYSNLSLQSQLPPSILDRNNCFALTITPDDETTVYHVRAYTYKGSDVSYSEVRDVKLSTLKSGIMMVANLEAFYPGEEVTLSDQLTTLREQGRLVAGYPVTVAAGEFATFYAAENTVLSDATPEGISRYTITDVSTDHSTVTLAALSGIVAGGTPMLVYNGTDDDQTVILMRTTDAAVTSAQTWAGAFLGTAIEHEFTATDMQANDYYALSGGQLFVPVLSAGTIAAHKCWLQFPKQQTPGSRSLTIVFDGNGTTGIADNKRESTTNNRYYDLNGRQLNAAPTQKGVYILNGKKVVVK